MDIDIILNCILVNENIRPSFLIQPADYGESTGEDPITKNILQEIKQKFPKLLQSEKYETYQGIIISKKNYNGKSISLNGMGKILGYPCYKDFENLDRNKRTYTISVIAILKNGEKIDLFVNICKDETKITIFNDLVRKAKNAFNNQKYTSLLGNVEIKDVEVRSITTIPIHELMHSLIENKNMNKELQNEFKNILENFGFTEDLINYDFQLHNPTHRGIILTFLDNQINDLLSPFYPLQNYPNKEKEVHEIIQIMERDLIYILDKTRLHKSKKNKKTRRLPRTLSKK